MIDNVESIQQCITIQTKIPWTNMFEQLLYLLIIPVPPSPHAGTITASMFTN
jgi:hypothetical protein